MNARHAQQAMMSGAVALVMTSISDPSWQTYLSCVRDVLPEAENCSAKMLPVWCACERLVQARDTDDRQLALCRLSYEVRIYFLHSLADRHAEWQGTSGIAA